jgi:hypothetical protein
MSPSNWRWTHAGLEKLFAENGPWESVRVTPASGTTARLGMIASIYLDFAFRQLHARGIARPLIAIVDTVAGDVECRSGTLVANFHVVAEVSR